MLRYQKGGNVNGLIIYTAGVLLVGLGFGFCWGWAEGRRKLRAELDVLYRKAIAPRLTWPSAGTAGHVFVHPPLYDQEQER